MNHPNQASQERIDAIYRRASVSISDIAWLEYMRGAFSDWFEQYYAPESRVLAASQLDSMVAAIDEAMSSIGDDASPDDQVHALAASLLRQGASIDAHHRPGKQADIDPVRKPIHSGKGSQSLPLTTVTSSRHDSPAPLQTTRQNTK